MASPPATKPSPGPIGAGPPPFGAHSTRRLPLKVIVCGVGRTGTTSMQTALETLGFPTFHATGIWAASLTEIALWNRALDAKHNPTSGAQPLTKDEWDVLLGGYSAVIEVSAVRFAADLAALYPDAKIIMVSRETESWFRSCVGAFTKPGSGLWYTVKSLAFPTLALWDKRYHAVASYNARKQQVAYGFEWHDEDAKEKAMVWYKKYYEEMKAKIPAERILEYTVRDGWGPLCEFLGVDVPTVIVGGKRVEAGFPVVNAAKGFKGTMYDIHEEVARAGLKAWGWRLLLGYVAWTFAVPYLPALRDAIKM